MKTKKLQLSDLEGADISQIEITYKSWGDVENNNITISGDGCCRLSICFEEKQRKLSRLKLLSLLNKLIECGFFELKESRDNFILESRGQKLSLSQIYILDGLWRSITLKIGDKQRCFEEYYDNCTALDGVFKEFDKLIAQAKKA